MPRRTRTSGLNPGRSCDGRQRPALGRGRLRGRRGGSRRYVDRPASRHARRRRDRLSVRPIPGKGATGSNYLFAARQERDALSVGRPPRGQEYFSLFAALLPQAWRPAFRRVVDVRGSRGSGRTGRPRPARRSAAHRRPPLSSRAAPPAPCVAQDRVVAAFVTPVPAAPRRLGSGSALARRRFGVRRPAAMVRASAAAGPLVTMPSLDRRIRRDRVAGDRCRAPAIFLIDFPLSKCSRRIRPIVSTVSIPHSPLRAKAGSRPADLCHSGPARLAR